MIAALYVQGDGVYSGLPDVDVYDEARDARLYAGPWPVVAHPPCQRWGRFWHGSPSNPHQFQLGDDKGCFKAALASVRQFGGVIEHPADSHALSRLRVRLAGTPPGSAAVGPATSNRASTALRRASRHGSMLTVSSCHRCAGALVSSASIQSWWPAMAMQSHASAGWFR